MIIYPEKIGTRIVSARQRQSFQATWHGTVADNGRTGALALNMMTGRYMSVIGADNIVQLDTDAVMLAMAQAMTPGPQVRTKTGREPLYKARMTAYPINLPDSMVEACKTLGDGNLAAGVRLCIDAFMMQSAVNPRTRVNT